MSGDHWNVEFACQHWYCLALSSTGKISPQEEVSSCQWTGASPMWRRREKTGTALYLDSRQVTLCFWMKADAIRIWQGGMPNSLGGSRAVDSAPLSKPKNTTILSSIQTLRYTTFSGGTTVERFKRYLEIDLLPHLNDNSVLIMDNMKSHYAKAVKNLLDSSGVRYIYLPPYSPDLNPIEKLWSKVKAFLRKFKARTLDALPNAIQCAFQTGSPSDCSGWFHSCGYSPYFWKML